MKKTILGLEKDWMAIIYGIMGILLIIFPEAFTSAIPYMLGLGLIAHGTFGIVSLLKYKNKSDFKPGNLIILFVLGIAILHFNADAIGPIGAIWAMISLSEVADEITESFENKSFSAVQITFSVVSVGLAILLMFNPFQHFAFHVRILGLEMLAMIFVRWHNLRRKKDVAENEQLP